MVFRKLVKDSAIYGGIDFLSKLIVFFAFPAIAAALSPSEFGTLELVTTITTLLGLVMNCGLNNATQRFYWDKDTVIEQRPVVVSSGLAVQIVFGLITLVVGLFAVPLIYPITQQYQTPLTWVALVAALFLTVFSQWNQFAMDVLRQQFAPWRFMFISLVSRAGSALMAIVAVVLLNLGIDGLLFTQALVVSTAVPLAFYLIGRDLSPHIDRRWMSKLLTFGYPFIFVGSAHWLLGSMDRWMLASMSTTEEVGIYSVAFRFATIVLFVSAAFGQAWSPVAIKICTEYPNTYREIYSQVLLFLIYIMLTVGGGLALFSGEIIGLIMPKEYLASSLPIGILCFGIVLQTTQQVTAIGISLEKKTFLFARLTWLTVLINFGLNWILIPRYDSVGASWATTISYTALTGSYFYCTQRLHPLPIAWKKLLFLLTLGGCVCLMAILANSTILLWPIILMKLIFALSCLGLGWIVLPIRKFRFDS